MMVRHLAEDLIALCSSSAHSSTCTAHLLVQSLGQRIQSKGRCRGEESRNPRSDSWVHRA
jgi:hypothetical protein